MFPNPLAVHYIELRAMVGAHNSEYGMIDVPFLPLYSWDCERRGRWRSPVAPFRGATWCNRARVAGEAACSYSAQRDVAFSEIIMVLIWETQIWESERERDGMQFSLGRLKQLMSL